MPLTDSTASFTSLGDLIRKFIFCRMEDDPRFDAFSRCDRCDAPLPIETGKCIYCSDKESE